MASPTVSSFNALLKSFLEQLSGTFPEEQNIALYLSTFDAFVAMSPRTPLDMFVRATTPHAGLIMARDPALFSRLQLPGNINLQNLWESEGVTDGIRDAIWKHVTMLFTLAQMVSTIPEETLHSIEHIASTCAEKVQAGELDFASLMPTLMSMLDPASFPETTAPRRKKNAQLKKE